MMDNMFQMLTKTLDGYISVKERSQKNNKNEGEFV